MSALPVGFRRRREQMRSAGGVFLLAVMAQSAAQCGPESASWAPPAASSAYVPARKSIPSAIPLPICAFYSTWAPTSAVVPRPRALLPCAMRTSSPSAFTTAPTSRTSSAYRATPRPRPSLISFRSPQLQVCECSRLRRQQLLAAQPRVKIGLGIG